MNMSKAKEDEGNITRKSARQPASCTAENRSYTLKSSEDGPNADQ
jgi:hypothetical protein